MKIAETVNEDHDRVESKTVRFWPKWFRNGGRQARNQNEQCTRNIREAMELEE